MLSLDVSEFTPKWGIGTAKFGPHPQSAATRFSQSRGGSDILPMRGGSEWRTVAI